MLYIHVNFYFIGFNMSVDLTVIHSDVSSDNALQNRAATCKLFADNDLQGQHQLETIHEESRSNYTGSTSSNSSKSTSRISMLSAATQPADDGVLLGTCTYMCTVHVTYM